MVINMRWLTPYIHLPGYLHRWCIVNIGRLRVRLHAILTPDNTPMLHTHPFHYISIVLSGGYTDQVLKNDHIQDHTHRMGSVIMRLSTTPHRIKSVLPNTRTLFFAWYLDANAHSWTLLRHQQLPTPQSYFDAADGIYQHGQGFRKRKNGVWYVCCETSTDALLTSRISIHQDIQQSQVTHALGTTEQHI